MKTLDVLVSGASIAGPAAALLLTRQGHRVTVVERAPALRSGGQTVDLRGAGRTVVDRMGLTAATDARLLDQRGIAVVDAHGRRRSALPVEAFDGNGIVSAHEILRGDLAETIVAAVPDSVEYVWNDTVTAIDHDVDRAVVSFETSADRAFDLVIGADGLNSAVRRAAFGPDEHHLAPIGLRYAWFTATIDQDLDGWYLMHNAVGGRVVSCRPSRVDGTVKASLAVRGSDAAPLTAPEDQWRMLEEAFDGVGWVAPQLLAQMRHATDWAYADLAQVRMTSFARDRVALVGDAGHCPTPLTGLGTTLALVGAYVLAGEISRADDVAAALASYEHVMRPFVARAQQLPPGGASGYAPSSRIAVELSRFTYWSMNKWPMRRLLASQFAKADGIDLPDYRITAG
ncbi:FAD-dependent monooxygenase [Gordonia humi]|uniref:2-polyprenyl-6-methoxyphenol hydroxylase-like FAD-dependent oxidoreductase n=1 Tax=Gordonia humi TaxID=686429 RepID=A0A840EZR6_9ACTN|nr:FAD-dependent monooxygenase [Gordonia humi]MBB4137101.1 2-polyprenyl-6-methoxyphenol hydroxylase-like FAD-dependent oxidoreductase [Gordonia humi]